MMLSKNEVWRVRRLLLCSLHACSVSLGDEGPFVSFSFDDFPRTAYTAGGAILKSLGARGTYYAALGLMNTQDDSGKQFTARDLDDLLADGHELACHTFGHISCRRVPVSQFVADVKKGREQLRHLAGYDPVNFSYPFGHTTLASKASVGRQMRSCRGTFPGVNGSTVDLNLLRANSLYGDAHEFPHAERLLRENCKKSRWLIFYSHDVRPRPSPFGCTPSLLEKTVTLALELGYQVAPVNEVIDSAERASSTTSSAVISR